MNKKFFAVLMALALVIGLLPGHVHAESILPTECDHDYEVVKEYPATCIESGYVWEKCSKCGWEYNHETPAVGGEHEYEVVKE